MKPTVHRPYDRAKDLEEGKKKENQKKQIRKEWNSPLTARHCLYDRTEDLKKEN